MRMIVSALALAAVFVVAGYGQSYQDLITQIDSGMGGLPQSDGGFDLAATAGLLLETDPTTGDTVAYAQIGIQPDFGIGKIGVGLDVTLLYNIEEGTFKETEFNETDDYLKIIRYVRYGKFPYDPGLYLKAGALSNATIGHGFIINRYQTDVDYNNRRAGAQVNFNYETFNVETFTNNLFLGEVLGVRGVVRPLMFSPLASFPILNKLGIGITMARDSKAPFTLRDEETYDADNDVWSAGPDGLPDWDENEVLLVDQREPLTVYGSDFECPVLQWEKLGLTAYVDFAQIRNVGGDSGAFSDGSAVGVMGNLKITEGNQLIFKAERRFIDRNFIPAYFDKFYEIQRTQFSTDTPKLTKQLLLESLPTDGRYKGIYGEATLVILAMMEVWATFQDNDDVPDDGALQAGLAFKDLMGVKFAAQYTKSGIQDGDFNDMFSVNDRSLLMAYAAYPMGPVEIGVVFQRNWALNLETGEYEAVDSYSAGATYKFAF
ncbi:MAG: hypothetical protein ABIF71_01175 [Planctomycetota bacterium]